MPVKTLEQHIYDELGLDTELDNLEHRLLYKKDYDEPLEHHVAKLLFHKMPIILPNENANLKYHIFFIREKGIHLNSELVEKYFYDLVEFRRE